MNTVIETVSKIMDRFSTFLQKAKENEVMMFSGYTDSAVKAMYQEDALSMPEGGSSTDSVGPFPVKYLPICQPPSPWFANSSCPLDFIFVSEFSEQEGPKPLITIPKEPGGKLDLNEFTVRIMSVDFQTAQNESFCITEDTQVILSESQDEIYAYVHHFTLYDSNARGFVRPFCMAYVTPDHKKLISFQQEMSKEFHKVSRYLKYGNMLMFVKDMTHYLTDLQFTRERLFEMSHELKNGEFIQSRNSAEGDIMKTLTLETINVCIQDVKNILEKASSQLTDKELETRFQQYEDKHKLNICDDDASLSASYSATQSSPKISKFLPRLSKSGSFSEVSQALSHQVPRNDIYKPKLVRTLNRRRFDHILRNLHELCGWGAKEGLRRLRSIHKFYNRNLAVLEIEREDSQLTVPQSSLLTIGRLAILNFLSSDGIDLSVGECTLNDRILSQSVGSNMRRWLSDETLASINSFDSSICAHEDDNHLINEPSFILGSSFLEHRGSSASVDFAQLNNTDSSMADSGASFSTIGEDKMSISDSVTSSEVSDCKDPVDVLARTVSIISPADHLANLTPSSIGYGILAFTNQFAFAPHVFYSLLTGRTVVVIGSTKMERDVRNVIKSLTLLVPGHSNLQHAVIPWQHKPIKMADLAKVKLVGLCKPERRNSQMQTQNTVRKLISILDVDRKTFDGPAYKGDFLTTVCNKRKSFKSERTFLALLNSMLMELSLKSIVYYHAFCMKNKSSEAAMKWEDPGDSQLHRVKSQAFMAGLSLRAHDGNIVQYLAEVVVGQQLEDLPFDSQNASCPVVALRYETCGTFKA